MMARTRSGSTSTTRACRTAMYSSVACTSCPPGAIHHHQGAWVWREVVHAVGELGAWRVDAAGNAHALVFLERPRIEDDEVGARRLQLDQLRGADARRVAAVLDELAEGLRRHV